MKYPTCKWCGDEILPNESIYEVEDGFVHKECAEDYLDDKWEELNLVNKLQLMGFSDCNATHRERYGFDDE